MAKWTRLNLNVSKKAGLVLAGLVAIATPVIPGITHATQGLYYVYNGASLTKVQSDPVHAQADRWAAFYFRKGASSFVISQRWGLEIQSTPAEVMKSVEARQKFERIYEKLCSCEFGSDTFFNVIAPVALTKSSADLSAGKPELVVKAKSVGNRIGKILETVNDASDFAAENEHPLPTTVPFAEYAEIHEAVDQYGKINNLISLLSDNAAANIERRLNRLADDVSSIEKISLAVKQPTSTPPSSVRLSSAVSYPITRTINGVKSVSNVVQAISDDGSEILLENHFDNGQWERHRVSISEVTSSPPVALDGSVTVWSVQLACKRRAPCVRWDGESPGLKDSDKDRNSSEIGVVFKTEAEANSFADRVSPSRLNPPSPARSANTSAATQPSRPARANENEGRKVYTIQVGVFTSESKAEAMVSQLKTRQYDAVFIDAIPAGTGPYHVRVGRLSDMQAAKDLQRKLQADGFATFLTTLSQ